jgi:hypothetical protein
MSTTETISSDTTTLVGAVASSSAASDSSCGNLHRLPEALLLRSVFGQLSIIDLSHLCGVNRTMSRIWCSPTGAVWEAVAAREYPDHRAWKDTLALRPATSGGGAAIVAAIANADAKRENDETKDETAGKGSSLYGSMESLPLVTYRTERSASGKSSIGIRVVDWKRVCRQMGASRALFARNIDEW